VQTSIQSATFTGLIPTGVSLSSISDVHIEIYRVFPNDSNVSRTSGPQYHSPVSDDAGSHTISFPVRR
jgi:hypothetical protein